MSALSELFQEIADAIRTKTGGTETMAPVTFPDNILSIVTGGSSGDSGELQFKTEIVKPTSTVATVTHGMGVVPDIICIFAVHVPSNSYVISCLGMTTAMAEKLGQTASVVNFSCATFNGSAMQVANSNGMELASSMPDYGHICNVTTTSFTFGGDTFKAYSGKNYRWFAIAGLT